MISSTVKEFIEDNIELIEQKEWHTLFDRWYHVRIGNIYSDAAEFRELYHCLENAGLFTCYEDTQNVRASVLKEYIDIIISSFETTSAAVHIRSISEELASHLGFANFEVEKIIEEYVQGRWMYDSKAKKVIF